MVDFCFFAIQLVGYGFRCSFQPGLCIAMSVQVTVDDWYFQAGHLKNGCRVLQFGACPYSWTLDNNKFHHLNFYLMILFCKPSKALRWLSVLTDIPSCRRCSSALRHLPRNHAVWILCHRWWENLPKLLQAVPVHWAIPSLLHCFVSQGAKILPSSEKNKFAVMPEGPECPCATGCSVVCFASGWPWNQSNWLDVHSD